jgi:hypothetical protein
MNLLTRFITKEIFGSMLVRNIGLPTRDLQLVNPCEELVCLFEV